MWQEGRNNIAYLIAYDLTYRKSDVISFLNENGYNITAESTDLQVANELFSFISSSEKNAEKYAAFLSKDDYRYIDPITITVIASALISGTTGAASVIGGARAQRQQAARLATQGINQEQALQLTEIDSRRAFLTNIFNAQQQIIQEDERAYRRTETLKKISISFLVLTLILGGVWLARSKK